MEILLSNFKCAITDKGILCWSKLRVGIELGTDKCFVSSTKIKEKEIYEL